MQFKSDPIEQRKSAPLISMSASAFLLGLQQSEELGASGDVALTNLETNNQ
jgi:hypothetical protein